jgi:hypothetical protein
MNNALVDAQWGMVWNGMAKYVFANVDTDKEYL